MCGIIGYVGKQKPVSIIIDGLRRLEYRGYDSSGLALVSEESVECVKSLGRIEQLAQKVGRLADRNGSAIGHTRWATHGQPSEKNAHPHCSCDGGIFVVHNGIIENHKELKARLAKKHRFVSETDTEVAAHLVEDFIKKGMSLEDAVCSALPMIKGTYAFAFISKAEPDTIVVAKNSSPLLIGIGEKEFFVASDASALLAHTQKIVYLNDQEIGVIKSDSFRVRTASGRQLRKDVEKLEADIDAVQKKSFKHFMLKEIFEEPEAFENAIRGRLIVKDGTAKLGGLEGVQKKLQQLERLTITGCGTALLAGAVGEYMIEDLAGMPVDLEYASELRYKNQLFGKRSAVLAISQSGETADTLGALEEAQRKGIMTLGIVNVVGSSIARKTLAGVYNHAGPEIGVASTKAFVSQLAILSLIALYLGRQRALSLAEGKRIAKEIQALPDKMRLVLKKNKAIQAIAKKYTSSRGFLYVGRKHCMPIAHEGALKLKEISYIHAEGYPAGEMKHGPIALVDSEFPSVVIAPSNSVYEKIESNIQEIKARKGKVIAIATEGNAAIKKLADDVIYIPEALELLEPIVAVMPLHLFAYHVADLLGRDIDKPRNLAKSVTVE